MEECIRDEWRKEMHEKPKLSMMKQITKCEVKSSCAFLKSKAERRMRRWNGSIYRLRWERGIG